MGDSARTRVRERFDWSTVIHAYQELWDELRARRERSQVRAARPGPSFHPLREDPFSLFACYATEQLELGTEIALAPTSDMQRLEAFYKDRLANYAGAPLLLASEDECREALYHLAKGPSAVARVLETVNPQRRVVLHRSLNWLAKIGMIRPVAPSSDPMPEIQ